MKEVELHQIAIAKEVFLSLIKWFLLVLVINNLIWAAIHCNYITKSFDGTSATIEANQETIEGDNTITQGGK